MGDARSDMVHSQRARAAGWSGRSVECTRRQRGSRSGSRWTCPAGEHPASCTYKKTSRTVKWKKKKSFFGFSMKQQSSSRLNSTYTLEMRCRMRYSAARASPRRMWVKYVSSSALTEAISLRVEDKTEEGGQRVKMSPRGYYRHVCFKIFTVENIGMDLDLMTPFFCLLTQLEGDIMSPVCLKQGFQQLMFCIFAW